MMFYLLWFPQIMHKIINYVYINYNVYYIVVPAQVDSGAALKGYRAVI